MFPLVPAVSSVLASSSWTFSACGLVIVATEPSISPPPPNRLDPADDGPIEELYRALHYLSPEILKYQAEENSMTGFLLDDNRRSSDVIMGEHNVTMELYSRRGVIAVDDAFGLVIKTGEMEYLVAGSRALISFKSPDTPGVKYGIGQVDEIVFKNGKWEQGRRLNGDETNRGRAIRLPMNEIGIQRVRIYEYK